MLDLTDDFQILDFPECVTYSSVTPTKTIRKKVREAVGFPQSEKEAVASGGVYVSFTRRWSIPDCVLGGIEPKLADTLKDDATLTTWTVQGITYSDKTEEWLLDTVNLNLAAGLRDTVTISQPMNTQDAALGRVPLFVPKHVGIACRFQEVSQDTRDERGRRLAVTRYQCFVASSVTANHEDRIEDGDGNVYEFISRESADRLDLLMMLNLERKSG